MSYWDYPHVDFSELVGKTLVEVINTGDEMKFICSDGSQYKQYHFQDCCESVSVEDICGDIQDIIGSPIVVADVSTSSERQSWETKYGPGEEYYYPDSFTWTFYKLDTIKGGITIRWYGTSNGYYGESVDFIRIKDAEDSEVSPPSVN